MLTPAPVERRGLRFSLRTLLCAVLSVSLVFGAYAWLDWPAALAAIYFVGAAWWFVAFPSRRVFFASMMSMLLGLCLPCFCGPFFVSTLGDGHNVGNSWRQLHQIGVALRSYHSQFGCFPPAYTADANGQPLYSWRAVVQPYVDGVNHHDLPFDFSQPWNSPDNLMPCQDFYTSRTNGNVTVFAVVGPDTAFPGAESRTLGDIHDDPAKTILLVEMVDSGINWAEPRELEFDKMSFQVGDPGGNAISARHWSFYRGRQSALALFADGHVEKLPPDIDPERLKSMLRIADGQPK